MTLADIANTRLISQQITEPKFQTAKDLVGWMGAIQAQDYAMARWAIGVRLPGSTDTQIQSAIDKGEIIRTHVLRPTWHLVSAHNIYWMLELTAPRIKSSLKSRHKELALTEKIFSKSMEVISKTLSGNNHSTREELVSELIQAKIETGNNRSSHILLMAELDGLICSGVSKGKKQTYALLADRVPKNKILSKEEALAKLALKYFSSHGPASLNDFTWWSGLSVSEARQALEMIKPSLVSETMSLKTFWMLQSQTHSKENKRPSIYLLPAYDEYIISYTDRSAMLSFENHQKSISRNGLFKPVIVLNGQVIGLWKRTINKEKVLLELDFFKSPNGSLKSLVHQASESFGHFLEKEAAIMEKIEQA